MPLYKYTLIISQLYFSRHFFIVHHNENFLESARKFTEKVSLYKRGDDPRWSVREVSEGDLSEKYCGDGDRSRYNVNDYGDLYFIQADDTNFCIEKILEYHQESIKGGRGYQSKKVLGIIEDQHDYLQVKEIVEKYFNIV